MEPDQLVCTVGGSSGVESPGTHKLLSSDFLYTNIQ